MIPTIETIVEDVASGNLSISQAIEWLAQREDVARTCLRDDFAGQAMTGMVTRGYPNAKDAGTTARFAYLYADALIAQRAKGD